jgi:hypothetical protein
LTTHESVCYPYAAKYQKESKSGDSIEYKGYRCDERRS